MSDEKPRRRSNRREKKAEKRATPKKIQRADDDCAPRKTKRMSGFLSVTLLAVGAVLASIAVSICQKGGYHNVWIALWWGVGACASLGLGLFYTYYHYVIGPAKIRKPSFAKAVGAYALLGFGLFFIYYLYVIGPAKIKFSVASEITISMPERNLRSNYWWVFNFGESGVAFPVTDMFYVRVTNRDSKPLLIIHYSVEVRRKGGRWRPATRIDTLGGHFFIVDPVHGLTGAMEVKPNDPILEKIVVDKNIAPNEAIRGWCFIERPEGYDGDAETREWRFKIKDVDGAEATAIMSPAVAKSLDQTFLKAQLNTVDRKDITGMTAIYYSEKSKLP